jgi:hypothetical protein
MAKIEFLIGFKEVREEILFLDITTIGDSKHLQEISKF